MHSEDQTSKQREWLKTLDTIDIGDVISANTQSLLDALNTDELNISDVSQKISLEPSLAAKILMITNSPFYGFPREIKDVEEAVVVLGAMKLTNIVYCSLVLMPTEVPEIKNYIKHSLATALYAKAMAEKNCQKPETTFIASLLHVLPLILSYQENLQRILSMPLLHTSSHQLLQRLQLPEEVIDTVDGLYSKQTNNLDALYVRMAFNLSTIALGKENAPFKHLFETEHEFHKIKMTPSQVAHIMFDNQYELQNLIRLLD
jgi:c-di-GMP-related signal transduction protein